MTANTVCGAWSFYRSGGCITLRHLETGFLVQLWANGWSSFSVYGTEKVCCSYMHALAHLQLRVGMHDPLLGCQFVRGTMPNVTQPDLGETFLCGWEDIAAPWTRWRLRLLGPPQNVARAEVLFPAHRDDVRAHDLYSSCVSSTAGGQELQVFFDVSHSLALERLPSLVVTLRAHSDQEGYTLHFTSMGGSSLAIVQVPSFSMHEPFSSFLAELAEKLDVPASKVKVVLPSGDEIREFDMSTPLDRLLVNSGVVSFVVHGIPAPTGPLLKRRPCVQEYRHDHASRQDGLRQAEVIKKLAMPP